MVDRTAAESPGASVKAASPRIERLDCAGCCQLNPRMMNGRPSTTCPVGRFQQSPRRYTLFESFFRFCTQGSWDWVTVQCVFSSIWIRSMPPGPLYSA
jgi:hypothetical protein